jgi:hypothetical protein
MLEKGWFGFVEKTILIPLRWSSPEPDLGVERGIGRFSLQICEVAEDGKRSHEITVRLVNSPLAFDSGRVFGKSGFISRPMLYHGLMLMSQAPSCLSSVLRLLVLP